MHAKIGPCTECHDDAVDQSLLTSNSNDRKESTIEFSVLSIAKVAQGDGMNVGCCTSNGITSIAINNEFGKHHAELRDEHGIFDETDIGALIEAQSTGLYEIHVEYENGMKEKRIIARL
jgi:hypothetical protein